MQFVNLALQAFGDSVNAATAKQFVQDTAAWNMNSAYGGKRSFANGLWYFRNGLPEANPPEACEPPEDTDPWNYALNAFVCTGDQQTGSISSATNATFAVLTCPANCQVSAGDSVHIMGATRTWARLNGTSTALAGSGTTFTVPFNSFRSGPLTGSLVYTNRNLQISAARFLAGEVHRSISQAYLFNNSSSLRAAFDCVFGGMWGGPNHIGPCADANYLDEYNPLGAGAFDFGRNYAKINGFAFGWGAGAQWPSARQGGVAAAMNRTLYVGFNLASVPAATQVRLTLTKPDGTTAQTTCTSSPCSITSDAREGDHLLVLDYLSAAGPVLATSTRRLPVAVQ
jgi:hypothetical protein